MRSRIGLVLAAMLFVSCGSGPGPASGPPGSIANPAATTAPGDVALPSPSLSAGSPGPSAAGMTGGSPRDRFLELSNTTLCARDAARDEVSNAVVDFKAQLLGYRHFSDATGRFADQLAAEAWGPAESDVDDLITAGRAQVTALAPVLNAKTPDDVLAVKIQVEETENTFATEVALVRSDLALDTDPAFMAACVPPTPRPSETAGMV
jgi:hypothetical protein